MHCTIYLLKNTINNKIYVGQTWLSLKKRMGRDGCNYKNSIYLYNAIQKYGANNFEYEVLATCEDQATADKLEAEFIIKYDSRNLEIGYNLKEGGSAGRHSEETIEKISKNASRFWLGKNLPEETKNKISEANTGNLHTEEWKEDNSKRTKEWHENNTHPMLGKTHSEETLNKMSEASKEAWKNGVYTEEVIQKRAKARRMNPEREQAIIKAYQNGDNISKIEEDFETGRSSIYRLLERNNIPLTNNFTKWTGREHTEETKQKMSEARKEYWDKNN